MQQLVYTSAQAHVVVFYCDCSCGLYVSYKYYTQFYLLSIYKAVEKKTQFL